jgi:hypothetical protein
MKPPVNIENLMKEWSEDSIVDATAMEKELLKISFLHGKYLNILSYHRHVLRKIEIDYKTMKSLREDYYLGRLTKEEMDERGWDYMQDNNSIPKTNKLVEADPEVTKILMKRIAHEEIVSYCESVLKSLNSRTWDLGNFVKYQQLTTGK